MRNGCTANCFHYISNQTRETKHKCYLYIKLYTKAEACTLSFKQKKMMPISFQILNMLQYITLKMNVSNCQIISVVLIYHCAFWLNEADDKHTDIILQKDNSTFPQVDT